MLIIRDSQKVALQKTRHPALVEKLLRVLARSSPERAAEALRPLVEAAVERAVAVHGLQSESGIGDYVGLAVELGAEFDLDEAVASRLASDEESPEARLSRVFLELSSEDWQRLRSHS